ncbi:MAG TPA: LytTR family DNA-binding domain-containing protein [Candidatus Acidoferrum sp.]|nr:LytTR family DNA-binding domain-containing protein [Candidatus Acidoferrum sp.]
MVEEIQTKSWATEARLQQDHATLSCESDSERFDLIRDRCSARELIKRFLIKSSDTSCFVRMDDIDWVGAAGNYVELHIGNRSHLIRKTMNAIEAELDRRRFLRIHRSVIVNIERIKGLRSWRYGDHKVVLYSGTQLTLKRCNSKKLEQLLGESI